MKSLMQIALRHRFAWWRGGNSQDKRFVKSKRLIDLTGIKEFREAVSGCPGRGYSCNEYLGCVCGGFFKRRLICENRLEMCPELKFMEDMQFQLKFLGCCHRVAVIPDITYEYIINNDSATHSWSCEQEESVLDSLNPLLSAIKDDSDLESRIKPRIAYYILLTVLDRRKKCRTERMAEVFVFLRTAKVRSLVSAFGSLLDRRRVLAPKHLLFSQVLKILVMCLTFGSRRRIQN